MFGAKISPGPQKSPRAKKSPPKHPYALRVVHMLKVAIRSRIHEPWGDLQKWSFRLRLVSMPRTSYKRVHRSKHGTKTRATTTKGAPGGLTTASRPESHFWIFRTNGSSNYFNTLCTNAGLSMLTSVSFNMTTNVHINIECTELFGKL